MQVTKPWKYRVMMARWNHEGFGKINYEFLMAHVVDPLLELPGQVIAELLQGGHRESKAEAAAESGSNPVEKTASAEGGMRPGAGPVTEATGPPGGAPVAARATEAGGFEERAGGSSSAALAMQAHLQQRHNPSAHRRPAGLGGSDVSDDELLTDELNEVLDEVLEALGSKEAEDKSSEAAAAEEEEEDAARDRNAHRRFLTRVAVGLVHTAWAVMTWIIFVYGNYSRPKQRPRLASLTLQPATVAARLRLQPLPTRAR